MTPRSSALTVLILATLSVAAGPTELRAQDQVLAVTTDWLSAGSLAVLPVNPPWGAEGDLVPIGADAVARTHGGLIYVVNRLGEDNVQVIDPSQGFQVVRQFSVGPGSNPQDIAVVSPSRAYVSRYETNDLLEVNPQTGASLGTISLAEFADGDGLCEMHRMIVVGGYLFVQVQRMFRQDWPDPWLPSPPSLLAVIDLASGELVDVDPGRPGTQGIELEGLNPIAPMRLDFQADLLVGETGQYGVIDAGGIERVDPRAWTSRGMVLTEEALGGDLIDFDLWSYDKGFVIVTDLGFNTLLAEIDPYRGLRTQVVYAPTGYTLTDLLVYPTGRLFVADRDYVAPGVRIYNAVTNALLAGPIDTGLPPFELLTLPGSTSEVAEASLDGRLGLPYPNPSRETVRLSVSGSADLVFRWDVFAPDGRLIRASDGPIETHGPGLILWDGRNGAGLTVSPGVYLIRVEANDGATASRALRVIR